MRPVKLHLHGAGNEPLIAMCSARNPQRAVEESRRYSGGRRINASRRQCAFGVHMIPVSKRTCTSWPPPSLSDYCLSLRYGHLGRSKFSGRQLRSQHLGRRTLPGMGQSTYYNWFGNGEHRTIDSEWRNPPFKLVWESGGLRVL
jgi:hypothetical protein